MELPAGKLRVGMLTRFGDTRGERALCDVLLGPRPASDVDFDFVTRVQMAASGDAPQRMSLVGRRLADFNATAIRGIVDKVAMALQVPPESCRVTVTLRGLHIQGRHRSGGIGINMEIGSNSTKKAALIAARLKQIVVNKQAASAFLQGVGGLGDVLVTEVFQPATQPSICCRRCGSVLLKKKPSASKDASPVISRAVASLATAVADRHSPLPLPRSPLSQSESSSPPSARTPQDRLCTLTKQALFTNTTDTAVRAQGLRILQEHKRHTIGLVAGTGLSMAVSPVQAAVIEASMDLWALNQFFFHPHLVPNFYNLETKTITRSYVSAHMKACHKCSELVAKDAIERSADMWRQHFVGAKRRSYRNTIFLASKKNANEVLHLLQAGSPCPKALVTYNTKVDKATIDNYGCTPSRLTDMQLVLQPDVVSEYCGSSLTRVLELMVRLSYSRIAFLGVDLNSPHHFYSHELGPSVRFDQLASTLAQRQYGHGMHATGARGVHHFISVFASHHRDVAFLNLAPSSLLANVSQVNTVPLSLLLHNQSIGAPLS